MSERLGKMVGHRWESDPKGLVFTLSRYKQVAKIVEGRKTLEVGCGDGFGSRIVKQHVPQLTAVDADPQMIQDAIGRKNPEWDINFVCHNLLISGPLPGFEAAYALDVFEHINPEEAGRFLQYMSQSAPVVIIGCPSLESQVFASELSKRDHVNCLTAKDLKKSMSSWFRHVFMFGMQDEALHTGFDEMRHYHLALGTN